MKESAFVNVIVNPLVYLERGCGTRICGTLAKFQGSLRRILWVVYALLS